MWREPEVRNAASIKALMDRDPVFKTYVEKMIKDALSAREAFDRAKAHLGLGIGLVDVTSGGQPDQYAWLDRDNGQAVSLNCLADMMRPENVRLAAETLGIDSELKK